MNKLLFDLSNPSPIAKATMNDTNRRSGTVGGTVRHSLMHTESPNATLHHAIVGARPHPESERAAMGDHYMLGYVSIPLDWYPRISQLFAHDWDISFIGPAGMIQRLPSAMYDYEDVLGGRLYLGFDWIDFAQCNPPMQQPSHERIIDHMHKCVISLREQLL